MNPSGPSGLRDTGRSLLGRSIVVTRAADTADELCDLLGSLGATPVLAPCIATEPPADRGAAVAAALGHLGAYATVVLTSPTGARRFLDGLADADAGPLPAGLRLAAIGPGTEAALAEGGIDVDLVADRAVAESLLEALGDPPKAGARLLLVRAEVGRDVLPEGLTARGWVVDDVAAYRTVTPPPDAALGSSVARADAVVFTSSSTVTGFLSRFGIGSLPPFVACIGPISAATARRRGIGVDAEADPHTLAGLTDVLIARLGPA